MHFHQKVLATLAVTLLCGTSCLADSALRYENIATKLQSLYMIDQQIKLEPKDALLYVQRAAINQYRKKYPDAIADYTKAIQMKYTSEDDEADRGQVVLSMRAICYMQMKNLDAAIADLTKAISIAPSDASLWSNKGAVYMEKKQFDLAMKDYTRALQIDPKQSEAYEGIGEVCYKTGQYARAIEYLNRAATVDTKFGDAFYYRGAAYKALGKKVEADKDFQKANSLNFKPGQPSLYTQK